jgi:hypothetical protein
VLDDVPVPKRWAEDRRDHIMTEESASKSTAQAKEKAFIATMDAITDSINSIRVSGYSLQSHSKQIKDLAFAYRLLAGGAQPGSIEVSK